MEALAIYTLCFFACALPDIFMRAAAENARMKCGRGFILFLWLLSLGTLVFWIALSLEVFGFSGDNQPRTLLWSLAALADSLMVLYLILRVSVGLCPIIADILPSILFEWLSCDVASANTEPLSNWEIVERASALLDGENASDSIDRLAKWFEESH